MDFYPEDVKEAADKMGSNFIKGTEFEGEGLVLQIAKPMEKIVASNPKYGATENNYLVKQEIMEVGQTLRFVFTTLDGQERTIDSTSAPFFIGFKQAGELGVGDWIKITRTGKTDQTRYTVEKIKDKPNISSTQTDYPEATDENSADIL